MTNALGRCDIGTKNAVSTSTQSLPSWLTDAYQGLVGKAQTQAGTTYQPYTGGFTGDQQTAFGNIGGLAGSQNNNFAAANAATSSALTPTSQTVGNYMSPYVQNVVNSTMANMQELNGQQQQAVLGNAISKGAMGGNRVGVAQGELARQQGLANNQTIAGLYNDAYNNALGAAQNQQQVDLSAGQGLASNASSQMNTNLAQGAAQLGAGTQQQQFNYQQYLNQQGYPFQNLSWLSSILGNSAVGGTTTTTAPYGNTFSSLLGAGLGVASLFNKGGAVPGYAKGGVVPYEYSGRAFDQGTSSWGDYIGDKSMPYAPDNAIFQPYIPLDDLGGGSSDVFPDGVDPLKDIEGAEDGTDPFSKYMGAAGKKGATNIKSWVTSLFGPKFGGGEANGYGSSYRSGGVVSRQHLADGGYTFYPSTQDVGNLYTGLIQPQGGVYNPGPNVMLPSNGQFSGLGVVSGGGGAGNGGGYAAANANDVIRSVPANGNAGSGSGYTTDAANPLDIGRLGLTTTDPFTIQQPQAQPSMHSTGSVLVGGGLYKAADAMGASGHASLTGPGGLVYSPAEVGSGPEGWDGLRSPEEEVAGVHQRQGMITGRRPQAITVRGGQPVRRSAGLIPSLAQPQQSNSSPGITAIGGGGAFNASTAAPDSPAGMLVSKSGSLGQNALLPASMNNSRWTTGYADGGKVDGVPKDQMDRAGLEGLMALLKHVKLNWKGRAESDNIDDRRQMPTDHFGAGASMPTDHFTPEQGFASGGAPKKKNAGSGLYAGILQDDGGGLVGDNQLVGLSDPAAQSDPNFATFSSAAAAPPLGLVPSNDNPPASNDTPDNMGMNQPGPIDQPPPGLIDYSQYGNTNNGAVPYTNGNQFTTAPQPQYSQNIGDAWNSLSAGKGLNLSPDVRQALLAAGMGMMAGHSPFALQNIGSGAMNGIDTWFKRQDLERENAKTRADIAQNGQNIGITAGQSAATNAASRYTFTNAPGGMWVTDTMHPGHPYVVPYGSILPDGTLALDTGKGSPDSQTPPGLFNTAAPQAPLDTRLLNPTTAPLAIGETQMAVHDARVAQQGSLAANQQLMDLEHSLDAMPDTGWLSQGAGFEERLGIAKNINAAAQVLGIDALIPVDQIANAEDANKVSIRLGQNLANTVGNPAAAIVMQSVDAVPGGYNSKAGAARIMGALRAFNQRNIDYYNFIQKWSRQNNGSILGADEYFNKSNPPELYALSAYVPMEDLENLAQHPETAKDFNEFYGNGKDVARYVINR